MPHPYKVYVVLANEHVNRYPAFLRQNVKDFPQNRHVNRKQPSLKFSKLKSKKIQLPTHPHRRKWSQNVRKDERNLLKNIWLENILVQRYTGQTTVRQPPTKSDGLFFFRFRSNREFPVFPGSDGCRDRVQPTAVNRYFTQPKPKPRQPYKQAHSCCTIIFVQLLYGHSTL